MEAVVQEGLARQRAEERERIAQEMLESMSRARSEHAPSEVALRAGRMNRQKILARAVQEGGASPFGIASLASDDMNLIMNNNFEQQYLTVKQAHDSSVRARE